MFTRKLVEKNGEVRVVQKRVITMYDYEDEEYTLDELDEKLHNALRQAGDAQMRELAIQNSFLTVWRQKIYPKTPWSYYKKLYEALTPHIEALEKLDEEIERPLSDE